MASESVFRRMLVGGAKLGGSWESGSTTLRNTPLLHVCYIHKILLSKKSYCNGRTAALGYPKDKLV